MLPRRCRTLFLVVATLSPAAKADTVGYKYDVTGIIGTGQSLSVGVLGTNSWPDDESHFRHMQLADTSENFDIAQPNAATLYLAPLSEPQRLLAGGSGVYPGNLYGVTPHAAFANQLSVLSLAAGGNDSPTTQTIVGESGRSITAIRKNGIESDNSASPSFAAALYEVQALKRLLALQQKSYAVGAVLLTHGENDAFLPSYRASLLQLQKDYQTAVSAITGQTSSIPLIYSQQSTLGAGANATGLSNGTGANYSWSAYSFYRAALDDPEHMVLTGPRYQLTYTPDGLHMLQAGYRTMGEKFAQVYHQVVQEKKPWLPTMPIVARRQAGNTLYLPYHAPVMPLQWAHDLPLIYPEQPPHAANGRFGAWSAGRGFEVFGDNDTPLTISDSQIDSSGTGVVLTVAEPLQGNITVRYAMVQDGDSGAALGSYNNGFYGFLCDSDPFIGRSATSAYCTLTNGSSSIACERSLWGTNVYARVLDSNGALAATVTGPNNNNLWSQWGLRATFNEPTRKDKFTFSDRYENYAVAFSLPLAFYDVSAIAPVAANTWLNVGQNGSGQATGACLVQTQGHAWAGVYAPTNQSCTAVAGKSVVTVSSFSVLASALGANTWGAASNGNILPGAMMVDVDDNNRPRYLCRAQIGGNYVPGWLGLPSSGEPGCHIAVGQQDSVQSNYQVLRLLDVAGN